MLGFPLLYFKGMRLMMFQYYSKMYQVVSSHEVFQSKWADSLPKLQEFLGG